MSLVKRIVVGGFPVGLVVALTLGQAPLQVPAVHVAHVPSKPPIASYTAPTDCLAVTVAAPTISLDPGLLASGDEVKVVQTALGLPADGVYGPQTAQAIPTLLGAAWCPPDWHISMPYLNNALQALQDATGALTAAAQARRQVTTVRAVSSGPVNPSQACADAAAVINAVWAGTGQEAHALNVVQKESGCTDTAYNPSGASGLFQLLGHQDLLDQVCPGVPNSAFDPTCNAKAALILSGGGTNWAPWAASGG